MNLLPLLKRIEWEGWDGTREPMNAVCPECEGDKPDTKGYGGHSEGCELKAAIDNLEALERGSQAPVQWVDRAELEKMYPRKQASEAGEPRMVEKVFNPLDHEGMK